MKKTLATSLSSMRRQYKSSTLGEGDLLPDPMDLFEVWYRQAHTSTILDPQDMTLATVSKQGQPSTRVVLLKEFGPQGFVFFTGYQSRKGQELTENPRAALNFYWDKFDRQVSVTGEVRKLSKKESWEYFKTRPLESRIATWASKQSHVLVGREELEKRMDFFRKKFKGKAVPLPPHWGGYRLIPESIEFWQGRPSRLNDRFLYTKTEPNQWNIQRLAP